MKMLGPVMFCFVLLCWRMASSEITGNIKISNLRSATSMNEVKVGKFDTRWKDLQICIGRLTPEGWILHECKELKETKIKSENEYFLPIDSDKVSTHIIVRGRTGTAEQKVKVETAAGSGTGTSNDFRVEEMDRIDIPLMFQNDGVYHAAKAKQGLEFRISLECKQNRFGPRCQVYCDSSNLQDRFTCHPQTGEMKCSFGWTGWNCSENIFIDRKKAFEFLSRPKRSEDRDSCSKRRCTKNELREEFLLRGSELTDQEWITYRGGESLSDCEEDHCDKNGTLLCLRLDGEQHACRCKPGYKGDKCAENDLCYFEPCHNGGDCEDTEEGVVCECPSGFRGILCEENIDNCVDNPCGERGECESDASGFRCMCDEGFVGEMCSVNIDDCQDDSCNGRGECKDGIHSYECICDGGYFGKDCLNATDGCFSEPCKNGGTCRSFSDGYFECHCPEDFEGLNCAQKKEDPCAGDTCSENGMCFVTLQEQENEEFSYKKVAMCACDIGYTGRHCETKLSSCEAVEVPCPANATCIDLGQEYECVCPLGYEGEYCEKMCNPCEERKELKCETNPCVNDARCLVVGENAICICPPSFTGQHCEIEIDYCEEAPCGHGECLSTRNGYECSCDWGFKGPNCEDDIDECEEQYHLCKEGGECRNTVGSYQCLCLKGYKGEHCDHEIDVCSSYPCQNGGTCQADGIDSFLCYCKTGFVGLACEIKFDYCGDEPCENDGKCEVVSLEEQKIKCICTERFYGESCEEEIPICMVKREKADGTHELIERTECGSYGKCVSKDTNDFVCECSEDYEGKFCDQKLKVTECNEPYCFCNNFKALNNESRQCVHPTYGDGKCAREECLAQNCTESYGLVCQYQSDCPNKIISPRSRRSNTTTKPCNVLVLFFKRQQLPQDATVGTICAEIRNSSNIPYIDQVIIKCTLKQKTLTDISISTALNTGDEHEVPPTALMDELFRFLENILNSRTNGSESSTTFHSLGALKNATFKGRTISGLVAENLSGYNDSSQAPVDKELSPKELYMIIPVVVVGSILVVVLLIAVIIWAKKIKRAPTPIPVTPRSDNNNLPQDSVKWSKSSEEKLSSTDNSLTFGVVNDGFSSDDKSLPRNPRIEQRIREEGTSLDQTAPSNEVSTFIPRTGALCSASTNSAIKR